MSHSRTVGARQPFAGMAQMVRFNASWYVAGMSVACAGVAVALWQPLAPLRPFAAAGAGLAMWWILASLAAGHFVYDRSPLSAWRWLADLLPDSPARWANVTAGFDESSLPLRAILGGNGTTVDLYDLKLMTEPSIRRARALGTPPADARPATPDELPFADDELDAAFVVFAAHELRLARDRTVLFAELRRAVRTGGRVVLVEHLRNAANIIAFGPGAFHFFAREEWLRAADACGLALIGQSSVTPFVRALVLTRRPDARVSRP